MLDPVAYTRVLWEPLQDRCAPGKALFFRRYVQRGAAGVHPCIFPSSIELKLLYTSREGVPSTSSVGAPPRALRTGKGVVFQARRAAWVHSRIFSSSIELKLLYTSREGVPSTSSVGAPPRALRTGKSVVFQVRRAAQGFELNYRPSLPTILTKRSTHHQSCRNHYVRQ